MTATARYAADIGCGAFQVFSGNPVGWSIGGLRASDRDGFVEEVAEAEMGPILVHAPYLINLATGDPRIRRLSRRALIDATTRASELRAGPVVVHAGNHLGSGPATGVRRAVRSLEHVLERAPADSTIAVEGGAGKGTEIRVTFDELAGIVRPFPAERVGVLLDTAHLWALGYDLRSPSALDAMLREFDEGPGLDRLAGLHGNDSHAELGSHHDRHALWSEGRMGRGALRNLVRRRELAHLPLVFEIPGQTPEFDRKRLASMRRMERRMRRAT